VGPAVSRSWAMTLWARCASACRRWRQRNGPQVASGSYLLTGVLAAGAMALGMAPLGARVWLLMSGCMLMAA